MSHVDLDLRSSVLTGATVLNGLVAGLLAAFSLAVMPGLRRVDDRTFVATMRAINVAILNPLFLLVWVGAPLLAVIGALLVRTRVPAAWPFVLTAAVLALATFVITAAVNVPLNDALERAKDIHDARDRFELRWTVWNAVRTLTSVGATGALALGLRLGR